MEISELMDAVRRTIIGFEGKITVSEFYLSDSDGERLELCMPPENVHVKTNTAFRTFNIVESGEIQIPKGEKLNQISWKGTLPGAPMLMYRYLKTDAWERPSEIINLIRRWRERGTKLKLLVTQTPINLDVYIKSFDFTHKGGLGNVDYSINFVAAKALQVRTVAEADARQSVDPNAFDLLERSIGKTRTGVMLATVNNIFEIALMLKDGDWVGLLERNGLGLDVDGIDPMIVLH